MTRSLFASLSFLLLLLAFGACDSAGSADSGPTAEEMIAKSWRLQKLNIKDEMAPPQIMATSSFNFYADGKYEILMGNLERGTWRLSDDKRILITLPEGGGENNIDLERIDTDIMVLVNNSGPNPVRMELVPE